jgi:hypothetical protein
VAEDAQLAICGVCGQESQVGVAVFVFQEKITAKVAALGDMVRAAHGHHASNACHRKYSGSTGGRFSRKRITFHETAVSGQPKSSGPLSFFFWLWRTGLPCAFLVAF